MPHPRVHVAVIGSLALAAAGAPLGAGLLPADLFAQTSDNGHVDVLDPHHLPLGDGRISSGPRAGYLYSCQQRFFGEGGANPGVPWIHGATWDSTEKPRVQGEVHWPEAQFSLKVEGDRRVVAGNDLPIDHPTGQFPISPSDPAYRFDRNPNPIAAQSLSFALPLDPAPAAQPSCVPMGLIGVALSGVAIFNALDDGGRDAVAHEVQDLCNGHPQQQSMYHYHGPSPCLPAETENLALIGYAIDGFGIFSLYDKNGREVTDADLDQCHGRVDSIQWDGRTVSLYHYTLTREYPYTVGCFRGTPVRGISGPPGFGPRRLGPPGFPPPASGPPTSGD